MTIILSREGGKTTTIDRTSVRSEDFLQRYVAENPDTLPLDEYKEDLELLVLGREFPTSSGPIDALGVDQDGEVYVIETKLYQNPDKRRVVAQVLDYGAALWFDYSQPGELLGQLETSASATFETPLREKIGSFFSLAEEDVEDLLEAVRTNISEGNFRFVVLMDELDQRLKDLITFVNENCRFDVFGVELELYRHEELEILLPSLYGAEVRKSVGTISGGGSRRSWGETSFFEDAEERLEVEELASVRELYGWASEHADAVTWGTGSRRGSFNPKFDHVSQKSVFSVFSDGQLQINFGWLEDEATDARGYAERLGEVLRERFPEFSIPEEFMESYPFVSVEMWGPRTSKLIRTFEDVLFPEEPEDATRPDAG